MVVQECKGFSAVRFIHAATPRGGFGPEGMCGERGEQDNFGLRGSRLGVVCRGFPERRFGLKSCAVLSKGLCFCRGFGSTG